MPNGAYLALSSTAPANRAQEALTLLQSPCRVCPRHCKVDRLALARKIGLRLDQRNSSERLRLAGLWAPSPTSVRYGRLIASAICPAVPTGCVSS
jgi:hypothetical protein